MEFGETVKRKTSLLGKKTKTKKITPYYTLYNNSV